MTLHNGIYEDKNGDKVRVRNTDTGYVITNTRTGEVTVIAR